MRHCRCADARFSIYSGVKRALNSAAPGAQQQQQPAWHSALAGSASGIGVAFWLTPVEFLKVRLQAPQTAALYKNPLVCLRVTLREEGVRRLFVGHKFTVVRESIGGTFYFGVYEGLCKLMAGPGRSKSDLRSSQVMLAGAAGGMSYWLSIFPYDTVKSRVQSGALSSKAKFFHALKEVHRTEGFRGERARVCCVGAPWSLEVARRRPVRRNLGDARARDALQRRHLLHLRVDREAARASVAASCTCEMGPRRERTSN
jgi:hypothetical protein